MTLPAADDTRHRIFADSGTSGEVGLYLLCALWFGAVGVMAFLAPQDVPMVGCASAPGLLPLALAVRATRTRLRYADAQLELAGSLHTGGRLVGAILLPSPAAAEDRIRATLVCQRSAGADEADPVLWRGFAFAAPADPRDGEGGRFPFAIEIPATCSPSGHERTYWYVEVNAENGLPALDLRFSVFVEGPSPPA